MSREIHRENRLLEVELGVEHGHPRFKWCFSENLFLPMRDKDNKRDYVADPDTGIIVAKNVFVQRKMARHLKNQWVVCRWMDPGPEAQWRAIFGEFVEYPCNGYYAPTNIELDPGIKPWDESEDGKSLTLFIIGIVREQAKKSYADHLDDTEKGMALREKHNDMRMEELIGEVLLPFGHVPGTRDGGVSIPSRASTANHDKVFASPKES